MSLPKSNGQTLLITGINGYIASVLGHLLLTKGYSIRGTARNAASTKPLLDGAYEAFKERVEIFEVPNMTVPGAFDEAVKGVNGVFHVASPIDMSITTYEGMVGTAVAGNLTLLQSALDKAGPQLSSVVVTSSVAAISNPPAPPGFVINETQFAHVALDKAQKDKAEGISTPPGTLYSASKTAAERALWEFIKTKQPKWSISTVNPTIVIGPPILIPSTAAKLNETLKPIWAIFSGEATTLPPVVGTGAFVDVRDVAIAHLWCYENHEVANGERYITAAGFAPHQATVDILREAYPERRNVIMEGEPGQGYLGYGKGFVEYLPDSPKSSGEKAERVMGLKYRDVKTSLLDTAKVFERFL